MALTPQPLRRADDPASNTTVLGPIVPRNWRTWSNKFQSNEPVNDFAKRPRHDGTGALTDWHGGTEGNDVDVSDTTQAIAGQNGAAHPDYEPRHQEEKGEKMDPPLAVLEDIGMDFGEFTGLTGRTGTIMPEGRYPSVSTEETPAAFRRANYDPPEVEEP